LVVDLELVLRDGLSSLIRGEIGDDVRAGFENAMEVIDGLVEERRAEELKAIPHQSSIEGAALLGECLNQEAVDAGWIALVLVVISIAEAIFEGGEKVFGIETGAQLGHELDVGGVGSAEVEEAKVAGSVERANELAQGWTGAKLWRCHNRGPSLRLLDRRRDLRTLRAQTGCGIIRSLHGAEECLKRIRHRT